MVTRVLHHARHPAKFYVLMILFPLLGGVWIWKAMRYGQFTVDASGATMVINSRPASGEIGVAPNTYISADINAGNAIDPATIDSDAVKLYRSTDGMPVASQVNTSAAGDAIVLQPVEMLENDTNYTFEVTDSLKDLTGAHVLPFKMTFTTASGGGVNDYPVAFEKVEMPGENEHYTCLTIGPDHHLYAGAADGKIVRFDLGADGRPSRAKINAALINAQGGPRLITGIRFDPKATAANPILWVSHGQLVLNQQREFSLEGATDWTGKISVLSGPELNESRDVVVNLPRSYRDHLNNQLDFGPDGALYFTQGSHTAMGAPDPKWGTRGEHLLTAALLRVDVSRIHEPLDVKTREGGGSYDPFASDAPLTIYASGVRVGYKVLWHSNGHLYTAINGSAAGGNVPSTPMKGKYPRRIDEEKFGPYNGGEVGGVNVLDTQDDFLFKIEKGGYYGHPNPTRAEYVLSGGNPTDGVDPFEVRAYPVGTPPDRNWRKPAYSFGKNASPNGMIEYKGDAFGGMLNGRLLITRFSGGKDILVLTLDSNGDVVEIISGIGGLTQFVDPLDLCEDESTGYIYVAEFKGQHLTLLRPISDRAKAVTASNKVFRQQVISGGKPLQ